jgi:hypothetical protein
LNLRNAAQRRVDSALCGVLTLRYFKIYFRTIISYPSRIDW